MVTSHGASTQLRVPEDGLPTNTGGGSLLCCSNIFPLACRLLIVEESCGWSHLEHLEQKLTLMLLFAIPRLWRQTILFRKRKTTRWVKPPIEDASNYPPFWCKRLECFYYQAIICDESDTIFQQSAPTTSFTALVQNHSLPLIWHWIQNYTLSPCTLLTIAAHVCSPHVICFFQSVTASMDQNRYLRTMFFCVLIIDPFKFLQPKESQTHTYGSVIRPNTAAITAAWLWMTFYGLKANKHSKPQQM